MARKKEACAWVLDVGRSMGDISRGPQSGLEKAKKALRSMIQQKLLFPKQDEMAIILVGTEQTDNLLNEADPEGYQHITVFRDMAKPNLEMLEMIDQIESHEAQGDVIDALLVAMAVINARVQKKKYEKRIFIVTDAAGEIVDDPEATEEICRKLAGEEYRVNIIGVGFQEDEEEEESDEEGSQQDGLRGRIACKYGEACYQTNPSHRAKYSHPGDIKKAPTPSKHTMIEDGRTETQHNNERFLRQFAKRLEPMARVHTISGAIDLFSLFRSRTVGQVTKLRGDLELSLWLKLPVYTYGKTATVNMPSLKRKSTLATEDESEVKMTRSYWNKQADAAEGGEDVDAVVDKIKALVYGKQKVPVNKDQEDAIKYKCEKGMKILAFMKAEEIPRHHFMGQTDVVVAAPDSESGARGLSALIFALHQLGKVALVRYVKRANSQPLFGVLHPVIKESNDGVKAEFFYFNQLPFVEDKRSYEFASFQSNPEHVPNQAQRLAARSFIKSMDLMNAAEGEDGKPMESLKPKHTFNPVLQRFYQCVHKRALDPSQGVEELDPMIQKYVNPPPNLLQNATGAIKKFQHAFPLTKVEKKEKKKRHWRDYLEDAAKVEDQVANEKKVKEEAVAAQGGVGVEATKLSAIVAKKVDQIGTVDPVADFKLMIARRDTPGIVEAAITQMAQLIHRFVEESFGDSLFAKAVACVQTLREGCSKELEHQRYNDELQKLKTQFFKKTPAFWNMLCEDRAKVQPFDKSVDPDLPMSLTQAQAFMTKVQEDSVAVPSAGMKDVDDEEDLFESME